jgi:hypothetical protein
MNMSLCVIQNVSSLKRSKDFLVLVILYGHTWMHYVLSGDELYRDYNENTNIFGSS